MRRSNSICLATSVDHGAARIFFGCLYANVAPAISCANAAVIRRTVQSWRLQLKRDKSIVDLAPTFWSKTRGPINHCYRLYTLAFSQPAGSAQLVPGTLRFAEVQEATAVRSLLSRDSYDLADDTPSSRTLSALVAWLRACVWDGGSGMNRQIRVHFYRSPRMQFARATHLYFATTNVGTFLRLYPATDIMGRKIVGTMLVILQRLRIVPSFSRTPRSASSARTRKIPITNLPAITNLAALKT